jgi:SGNH hydrolase-like domain, acetyltransferase AlgX
MNTHDKQLKSYLTLFAITAFIPIILFGILGFILQPVSGDLTRLGKLAERDFGWNIPQPVIQTLPSIPTGAPDVVVLGDSFSQPNIWQTIVTNRTNLKLLTFSHLTMRNPDCIEQWLKAMPDQYPSAKIIIIQTTEKSFWPRFNANPLNCKGRAIPPHNNPTKSTLGTRPMGYQDIMPDPVYALRAIFNLRKHFDTSTRNPGTIIEPLNRSDLFSSRRADLLLYFKGDVNQQGVSPKNVQTAMTNIAMFQEYAARKGVRLIINVVPDKSSVYTRFFKTPNPELVVPNAQQAMADRAIKSIDLFTPFNEQVEKIKDLYLPNDSHLSTRGYILMGEVIADALTNKARSSIQ